MTYEGSKGVEERLEQMDREKEKLEKDAQDCTGRQKELERLV